MKVQSIAAAPAASSCLRTGVEPPARPLSGFTRLDADGFELSFDGGRRLPETIVLELSRRKRRVRAFWDGCAFVL